MAKKLEFPRGLLSSLGTQRTLDCRQAFLTVLHEIDYKYDGGREPKVPEPVGGGCLGKWEALSNLAYAQGEQGRRGAFSPPWGIHVGPERHSEETFIVGSHHNTIREEGLLGQTFCDAPL